MTKGKSFPEQVQSTFTRTSLHLEVRSNQQTLSVATGFIITAWDDAKYLVTNWHVLAGRDAETGACLSSSGAIPDEVRVYHHSLADINRREPRIERLYHDPDNTTPRWLEHPRGRAIDVVLLPLTDVQPPVAIAPFSTAWADTGILELPGLQVAVIGFPYGLHVAQRWPIWKTGHIASDPGFAYDDKPSFLIDITTRQGMSGSPIVYQSPGPFFIGEGEKGINARMKAQFLGVYSGRIHKDSEIGRGWPPEVIRDIVQAHRIPLP